MATEFLRTYLREEAPVTVASSWVNPYAPGLVTRAVTTTGGVNPSYGFGSGGVVPLTTCERVVTYVPEQHQVGRIFIDGVEQEPLAAEPAGLSPEMLAEIMREVNERMFGRLAPPAAVEEPAPAVPEPAPRAIRLRD